MHTLDLVVLVGYFVTLIAIGVISSRRIKQQEDFFMGGRSFGKLLQTFAAFGAGTGSSDPVNTGRTTFTSGMSGMWSVMYWLFVTPFYWITAVWYRRMRHLTLGDWFVERYESKGLGAAYCAFGLGFFILYGSMMFSAIGKVAAPLIEMEHVMIRGTAVDIEYVLVPLIGVVVLLYGILGGLRAAYFTDLIQGLCIILLSIILVPYGLQALVDKFGNPDTDGLMSGFTYMHQQLPPEHFRIIGSASTSEFPLHRIIAVVIINLVGIVVQPHFIATGGGSAKTETTARVGLVVGNFLKRFCTVGWVLTALIALALYADNPELVLDPDKTWGVASRELLGPGLTGLMLACLLAALMSSIDAYMIVGSGLMVRNVYAAYINSQATEEQYVRVARATGILVVGGAVVTSLYFMDVFVQLQLTWVFQILFAAPFWVGIYWRRATTSAAWITVIFNVALFFAIPFAAPRVMPDLRTNPTLTITNSLSQRTTTRPAAPSDVEKRRTQIASWHKAHAELSTSLARATGPEAARIQSALDALGTCPAALAVGDPFVETSVVGGRGIFFPDGVVPVDDSGRRIDIKPLPSGPSRQLDEQTSVVTLAYPEGTRLAGRGNLQLDFLLYRLAGVNLSNMSDAALDTLSLPPKIITPFLIMILFSWVTRPNSATALDRYYTKMKTPVDPDPEVDQQNLEAALERRDELEQQKLFPGSNLEFRKPALFDVAGFLLCFCVCFAIIGVAVWIAGIGV